MFKNILIKLLNFSVFMLLRNWGQFNVKLQNLSSYNFHIYLQLDGLLLIFSYKVSVISRKQASSANSLSNLQVHLQTLLRALNGVRGGIGSDIWQVLSFPRWIACIKTNCEWHFNLNTWHFGGQNCNSLCKSNIRRWLLPGNKHLPS